MVSVCEYLIVLLYFVFSFSTGPHIFYDEFLWYYVLACNHFDRGSGWKTWSMMDHGRKNKLINTKEDMHAVKSFIFESTT